MAVFLGEYAAQELARAHLLSFSLTASGTGTSPTITIPGTPTAGDLCLIANFADGAGVPTKVIPVDFTEIANVNGSFDRLCMSAKILTGSETTVTGMNSLTERWICATFTPSLPLAGFATGMTPNGEITSGDPAQQTITASGAGGPAFLYGQIVQTSIATIADPTQQSPSMNAINLSTYMYMHWRSDLNGQDTTYDMDDEGSNGIQSGYLTFTLA